MTFQKSILYLVLNNVSIKPNIISPYLHIAARIMCSIHVLKYNMIFWSSCFLQTHLWLSLLDRNLKFFPHLKH